MCATHVAAGYFAGLLFASTTGLLEARLTCDVKSTGPVCVNGGNTVLMPAAAASALGGHWTFDQQAALDASGNGNHGVGDVQHGPAPAGSGYSAFFEANFLMVPDSEQFHTEDFSYSFWVYMLDDPVAQAREAPHWCPLLRKGVYLTAAAEFANAPALLFSRNTGHLRASVTTSVSGHGEGEFVDSNARILPARWVHLAVVHHGAGSKIGASSLLIYVNGILDAKLTLQGVVEQNTYPLYIGGDPFTAEDCQFKLYVDEVRMYGRAVAPHELQAEAAPAVAGIDPSFVHLGCLRCSFEEAVHSCPPNRHICSALELHTGGYQVARALGWFTSGVHVWTHSAIVKEEQAARQFASGEGLILPGSSATAPRPSQGLALCCEEGAA